MRNVAPYVQFIAVAARLVNNTNTHRQTHVHGHPHIINEVTPPPPQPKTGTPSNTSYFNHPEI